MKDTLVFDHIAKEVRRVPSTGNLAQDALIQLTRDRVKAAERIERLETALQVAFNHCADWSNDDMRDHCWAALKASRTTWGAEGEK